MDSQINKFNKVFVIRKILCDINVKKEVSNETRRKVVEQICNLIFIPDVEFEVSIGNSQKHEFLANNKRFFHRRFHS